MDPRELREALAEALKKLRGGRQQKQLAAEAGVQPNLWSGAENGRRYPRPENRGKIARVLGFDTLEEFDRHVRKIYERRREERFVAGVDASAPDLDWSGHLRAGFHHLHRAFELALVARREES